MKRTLSAACPGVRMMDRGRQRRSKARWTLLVSPPREQPSSAARSRALRRRRTPQRCSRSGSSLSADPSPTGSFCPFPAARIPPPGLLQILKELGVDDHARRVVMRAGNGRVHADQAEIDVVAGRRLGGHRFHEGREDFVTRPPPEAVIDRRPGAVALRHIPPGAAGTEPPHHRVEGAAQVRDRSARPQRQVRLDQLPFGFGQITTIHATGLPQPASS